MSSKNEQRDHREELILIEPIASLFDLNELADQIVLWMGSLLGNELHEVLRKRPGQHDARGLLLTCCTTRKQLGPFADQGLPLRRHAQHIRDHIDRQREGIAIHQIQATLILNTIDQLISNALNTWT